MQKMWRNICFGLIATICLCSANVGTAADERANRFILVFYASWCGPCNQMKKESWPNDGVCQQVKFYANKKIYRIDSDKYPDWVNKYSVDALPTIVIVDAKTMKPTSKNTGFMTAEQLERFLSYPDHVSFSKGEKIPIQKP